MMLNRNQNSHLRATDITDLLVELLKHILFKFITAYIFKYGKIAWNWAKPSLIEYKNRAVFVFHTFAFITGIESPLKYMLTVYSRQRKKGFIDFLIAVFLGLCLSSKASKKRNFRLRSSFLLKLFSQNA